jgi:DNA-binding response OmpR family regulator
MSIQLQGQNILLVDDDNDILLSLQAAFETTGATLHTAKNGNDAVEVAERVKPDLMILDLMLPGRSGFLVLEKLKKRRPTDKPYVIMITGNQGSRHKDFAATYGVNEYLQKPVKLDKLLATAEKLLKPAT